MNEIISLSKESYKQEKQKETELVVYAKITDFNDFIEKVKDVVFIDMEQLQASLGKNQNCRCRKEVTKDTDVPLYTYTVKTNSKRSKFLNIKTEYNFPVDSNFFEYFKTLAETIQVKKRYTFKANKFEITGDFDNKKLSIILPDILYEIDVFERDNGYRSNWVKVDIELDKAFKYLEINYPGIDNITMIFNFKELPFNLENGFIEKHANADQKKLLDDLWKYEFKSSVKL